MFYEWKDIKGRKKEEKDRIPIFIFLFLFSQMNLLSYILCYFMLAYRVKAIIIICGIMLTLQELLAMLRFVGYSYRADWKKN